MTLSGFNLHVFRCENCRGVFVKAWPDAHARAEFEKTFPGERIEDAAILCGECYRTLLDFYQAQGRL